MSAAPRKREGYKAKSATRRRGTAAGSERSWTGSINSSFPDAFGTSGPLLAQSHDCRASAMRRRSQNGRAPGSTVERHPWCHWPKIAIPRPRSDQRLSVAARERSLMRLRAEGSGKPVSLSGPPSLVTVRIHRPRRTARWSPGAAHSRGMPSRGRGIHACSNTCGNSPSTVPGRVLREARSTSKVTPPCGCHALVATGPALPRPASARPTPNRNRDRRFRRPASPRRLSPQWPNGMYGDRFSVSADRFRTLVGNSLTAEQRTLTPSVLVRIQVPQPT